METRCLAVLCLLLISITGCAEDYNLVTDGFQRHLPIAGTRVALHGDSEDARSTAALWLQKRGLTVVERSEYAQYEVVVTSYWGDSVSIRGIDRRSGTVQWHGSAAYTQTPYGTEMSYRRQYLTQRALEAAWGISKENETKPVTANQRKAGGPSFPDDTLQRKVQFQIAPVLMPKPLAMPVKRVAVLPAAERATGKLAALLDTALNFLRSRHPDLVLVERDMNPILKEIHLQHSGKVDDESVVRIGRWAGADVILTYQVEPSEDSSGSTRQSTEGTFELRLIHLESATVILQQTVTATVTGIDPFGADKDQRYQSRHEAIESARQALRERDLDDSYLADMAEVTKQQMAMDSSWFDRTPPERQFQVLAREVQLRAQAGMAKRGPFPEWSGLRGVQAHEAAVLRAAGYALAALMAALGDNPLGIVPAFTFPGEGVRINGVLYGGPAHHAGIKVNDLIVSLNGQSLRTWTDQQVSFPAILTIERGNERRDVRISDP